MHRRLPHQGSTLPLALVRGLLIVVIVGGILFRGAPQGRGGDPADDEPLTVDLLIVGGDEAGCAAAVQAARLGVRRLLLVNDLDWLGGQFSWSGIGPVDEWTLVEGRRVNFPRSGLFQEIIEQLRAHNRRTYGRATPGNGWCGTETIEPQAAARLFDQWLAPYTAQGTGQLRILRGWRPARVLLTDHAVTGVEFERVSPTQDPRPLRVHATLTIDASDWGDVIRLSGADYLAGPDLRSRFDEPSAPETLAAGGEQEMNPLSWCPLLREADHDATLPRPARYDARSFADWEKAPPWRDWDGRGGIYNAAGWSIYTHRRMVDRRHFGFAPGTEATILNWPAHDYPLSTLPQHVVDALEQTEPGASRKNIVAMSARQREIIYEDAKQRALEFLYWLQTAAHDRVGDFPESFRYLRLADDYGTADRLPPKPYIREGLRLVALYVLREQDVRTEVDRPGWARVMVPDGVFGYQFNMDFHPTRRHFIGGSTDGPWQPRHYGTRNWSSHTDRAMFPLRGLVPLRVDGLLGCAKNIGVSSLVQSSLRLHGQMMHVGGAAGTVAAVALRDGLAPRAVACSGARVREVQRLLMRGAGGPGTLLWPWHDLAPDEEAFEAANLLTIAGIWRPDPHSLRFQPAREVTRGELAGALVRLIRALPDAPDWPAAEAPGAVAPGAGGSPSFSDVPHDSPQLPWIRTLLAWGDFGPQLATFQPDGSVDGRTLHRWLAALRLPNFESLLAPGSANQPLTRAVCVDYLARILQQRGEWFARQEPWFVPDRDDDQDGRVERDDPLPGDRDNDSVPDRLQPPGT